MPSIFVRAFLTAVVAASAIAWGGNSSGTEIPKPVLRPVHDVGSDPALEKQLPPPPPGSVQTYGYGRIILLRGLMNVFSRGMDTLQVEMKQRGLPVELYNHSSWQDVATKLMQEYKTNKSVQPIILIGHSLGADASLIMSDWLAQNNVPVRLVVTLDGVVDPAIATFGNAEVINYYKPHGFGQEVKGTRNFHGTITNIDLTDHPDIEHLNIDKIQFIHDAIITKVLEIMKKKPTVTAKG
jgi:hypothetical protein